MTPADLARIEEIINALEHDQYHGCVTGDCPHEYANQCHDDLVKVLREHAKDAESLRALLAAAKAAQATAEYKRTSTDDQRSATFYAELWRDQRGIRAGQAVVNDLSSCERALAASQRERDEALQLTECYSSLKDLVAGELENKFERTRLAARVAELETAMRCYTEPAMQTIQPGKMFEHFYALLSTPLLSPQAPREDAP